jgi:hypothetical protein
MGMRSIVIGADIHNERRKREIKKNGDELVAILGSIIASEIGR